MEGVEGGGCWWGGGGVRHHDSDEGGVHSGLGVHRGQQTLQLPSQQRRLVVSHCAERLEGGTPHMPAGLPTNSIVYTPRPLTSTTMHGYLSDSGCHRWSHRWCHRWAWPPACRCWESFGRGGCDAGGTAKVEHHR